MNSSLQPSPVYTQTPPSRTNGNAVASLVLGIGSWVIYLAVFCFNLSFGTLLTIATYGLGSLCLIPLGCISPIMWLVAVITGHIGMKRAKEENGNGRGMALAGLILGYLGLGIMLVLIITAVVLIILTGGLGFLSTLIPYYEGSY
jgi:Domain of unknown function (DUF4190)